MPKGALLHAHLDAMVNVNVLLKLALDQPAMHVRAPLRLTVANVKALLPEFRALPRNEFSELTSLTDDTYRDGQWVPLRCARENFDTSLGGPAGFDEWVTKALTINPSEAYGTHDTPTKVCVLHNDNTAWRMLMTTSLDLGQIFEHIPR